MTPSTLDQRLEASKLARNQFWQTFTLERFGTITSLIALFIFIGGAWIVHNGFPDFVTLATDFYANVSSELASIVITVLIVDRLNRQRERRDNEALQKRLDAQELNRLKALLGSDELVVTRIAVAELRAKGWLQDGSLRSENLYGANLSKAQLTIANLQGAYLADVNLQQTNLSEINLENARLMQSNLKGAYLLRAKLQGVDFRNANLEVTTLWEANLSDANLEGANLKNANVFGVRCNTNTILPDGSNWTSDADWIRFETLDIFDWDEWMTYRESFLAETNNF